MTSVASWDGASTAGNYTLVYSGITLGLYAEDMKVTPRPNAEPNVRHNFWGTAPVIDNSDASQSYEWEITVITQGTTPGNLFNQYLTFMTYLTDSTPRNTTINSGGSATVVCSLGACILTGIDPGEGFSPYNFSFSTAKMKLAFVSADAPKYV